MKIFRLDYIFHLVRVDNGKETIEPRSFTSDKIEEIIKEYRKLKGKWYISDIKFLSGRLFEKDLSEIDALM